jgi:hypothetical protein
MRNTALLSTTLVIVCALASSPAASQVPAAASASGAPVISDHVAASWHIEQIAAGPVRLVFLLLYRGQPGWHEENSGSDGHGSRGSDRRAPGGALEQGKLVILHREGGIDLDVVVDRSRNVLRVLGEELPFDRHNVFLIDRVDGVGGPPHIVGRLRIDPELKLARLPVADIIAATPPLQAFARQE